MIDHKYQTSDIRHPSAWVYCLWSIVFGLWFLVFGLWSCEASGLLYSRLTDGFWQIWKETEEGVLQQLTFSPYDKRYPAFTREGELVYQTHNNRFYRIKEGKEEALLKDLWPVRDPAPSPIEDLFVFSRYRTDLVDQCNLWLFSPMTGERRKLTREEGIQYQPAWSPDGMRITYSWGEGPRNYDIFVINKDASGKRQLTKNQNYNMTPSWSPDGSKIAFSSNRTGDYEIWVINTDGSEPKQLTDSTGLDIRPVFALDGRQIAFTSNRSGRLEIWVTDVDGSNPRRWAGDKNKAPTCDPSWF